MKTWYSWTGCLSGAGSVVGGACTMTVCSSSGDGRACEPHSRMKETRPSGASVLSLALQLTIAGSTIRIVVIGILLGWSRMGGKIDAWPAW